MSDLTSPGMIYVKGLLLLACGGLAAGLLWIEAPTLERAVLLVLTAWGFARAYYCAFYVIERYVDSRFRFAGLWSVVRFLLSGHRRSGANAPQLPPIRR